MHTGRRFEVSNRKSTPFVKGDCKNHAYKAKVWPKNKRLFKEKVAKFMHTGQKFGDSVRELTPSVRESGKSYKNS